MSIPPGFPPATSAEMNRKNAANAGLSSLRFRFTGPVADRKGVTQGQSAANAGGPFVPIGEADIDVPSAANPATGGSRDFGMATFADGDSVVFATAVDGDTHPRVMLFAGSGNGMVFGPGNADPYATPIGQIWWNGSGFNLYGLGGISSLQFRDGVARLLLENQADDGIVDIRADGDGAKAEVFCKTGQTENAVAVYPHGSATPVMSVSPAGSVRPNQYTTAGRPSAVTEGVGATIFDTDLGIPIWSDGTDWVNALGVVV